jgi:hypothetical protein
MTSRQDHFERVRAANPVPAPIEPDWGRVAEHVARGSRAEADGSRARSLRARAGVSLLRLPSRPAAAPRRRDRRARRRVLGALALCAAVAAAAVVAAVPRGGSSDFLARAAAALTPGAGTVLYERWEHTVTFKFEPGNPERRVSGETATNGPDQLWIEGGFPRRYRVVLEPKRVALRPGGFGLASAYGVNIAFGCCARNVEGRPSELLDRLRRRLAGRPLEIGGTLETPRGERNEIRPTLTFLPPNELFRAHLQVFPLGPSLPGPHDQNIEDGADPVGVLRAAIAEGRAHDAGAARFDGRVVRRIDFKLPEGPPAGVPAPRAGTPVIHAEAYAYVEPETLRPVEIVFGRDSWRFLAYEDLPATAANLALTNIEAQHRGARRAGVTPKRRLRRSPNRARR